MSLAVVLLHKIISPVTLLVCHGDPCLIAWLKISCIVLLHAAQMPSCKACKCAESACQLWVLMVLYVQAMAVRGEEQEALQQGQSLDSVRKFSGHQIVELDEGGMSELASACKAAGLERLFLTAMKISK